MRKVLSMGGHWWGRALAFVGLLVVVGLVAGLAYNAGTMHAVDGAAMAARHAGEAAPMYGYGQGHGGWGHGPFFGGFIIFRLLFGLLFFFLLFRLLGFVIFGRRHWGGGPGGFGGPGGYGGPPWERPQAMFEDWHRSVHASEAAGATPPPAPAGSSASTAATEPQEPDEPRP